MNFYQLDYVVEEVLKDTPSREQAILKRLAKKDFSKKEAAYVWERITDHKWYLGERLKRDVGFHVATIDFLENFYEPRGFYSNKRQQSGGFRRVFDSFGSGLRNYFVSKSKSFQL
jgi:hypothetical protein